MTKYLLLFLVLLYQAGRTTTTAQGKYKVDSLIFREFRSTVLAENRRVIIHLPLHYRQDSMRKYPVMYVLDGSSQDQHTFDKIAVLSAAGLLPECIVVGILNSRGNRNRDQTPPFMQTETDDPKSPLGKADLFLDFIETELIPLIDSSYRTSGYKTITGHSRGGLFVLYTLLQKPALFNARFCYSTPAWRFNDIMLKKIEQFLKTKPFSSQTFLFFSVGQLENENIVGSFHRLNTLLKTRRDKRLTWVSYLTPFTKHQDTPFFATSKGLFEWSKWLK